MPQAAQNVPCPNCQELIEVSLAAGKQIETVEGGHSSVPGAVNQLCTSCLEQIHVLAK